MSKKKVVDVQIAIYLVIVCLVLLTALAVAVGNIWIYGSTIADKNSRIQSLSGEYEPIKKLIESVEKGATLQFEYTFRYGLPEVETNVSAVTTIVLLGPWGCIIYSPYPNSTVNLYLSIKSLSTGSYVPISVLEGNAYDFGTDEMAPVIWSVNATATGPYSVPLSSGGWYTISLTGSVCWNTITLNSGVDCQMSLTITHEGRIAPFTVK
jgi:hypothetical protein